MLETAPESRYNVEELYATIDAHMTDSIAHNKGLATKSTEKMGREHPADQLFCNPHTAFRFDQGFEAIINTTEMEIGMDNIFSSFLLEVSIDHNNETISLFPLMDFERFQIWFTVYCHDGLLSLRQLSRV